MVEGEWRYCFEAVSSESEVDSFGFSRHELQGGQKDRLIREGKSKMPEFGVAMWKLIQIYFRIIIKNQSAYQVQARLT